MIGAGSYTLIQARNPATICCREAILVAALLSVGVPQHPQIPFEIKKEELDGEIVTAWRWLLGDASTDGLYKTAELVKRWDDEVWLAANPAHEWTILRAGLLNFAAVGKAVRESVASVVIRRGKNELHIPENATVARRAWLVDRFEGRVPMETPFIEPEQKEHSTLSPE